jgi:hypothetical protein
MFRLAVGLAWAAIIVCGLPVAHAVVVTDDFSDLDDTANPAWTRLDGAAGSTGQTWDASTGAYHLVGPGNSAVVGLEGYGFVGSHVEPSFTDVRVSADFVEFPNIGPFGSFFGVAARMNGDNRQPTQGIGIPLNGYAYIYESPANGGLGEMVLNIFYGDGLKDIRSQKQPVALDQNKDYRFQLEVIGDALHGQVFELDTNGDVVAMIAEQWRDVAVEPVGNVDHDGDNTTPQIPFVPFNSGFSGILGVGHVFQSDADFTIDNFRTETALAGDYDRNGVVNAADHTVWASTYGQAGPVGNPPTSFGDMRANGAVTAGEFNNQIDAADYVVWRKNLGAAVAAGGGSVVPEPTASVIAVLGLISAGMACRRRG